MTERPHQVLTEPPTGRAALVSEATSVSWGDLAQQVARLVNTWADLRGSCIGIVGDDEAFTVCALLALDALDCRVHLLPALEPEAHAALVARLGLRAQISEAGVEYLGTQEPASPGVVLFTSGTTGLPKGALHDWQRVTHRVRVRADLADSRWLLTYPVRAFAGLQVTLHALFNHATLCIGQGSPAELAFFAARSRVTHISGTPTFFRFFLATSAAEHLDAIPLRQITLGGEAADQITLDRLKRRFPAARIAHIYASTELGACFTVQDGRAGFPASWLNDTSRPVELAIRNGRLCGRSKWAMQGYVMNDRGQDDEGWFDTGDVVEVRDGRVLFLGRQTERLNIGGNKVWPSEVEAVIRQVTGVSAARVSGWKSSLAGQLVRAEVLPELQADREALRRAVLKYCREQLPSHAVPRKLDLVDTLVTTASGKLSRRDP